MGELKFIEDSHQYFLDGEEIPSVTELCKPIADKVYKGEIDEYTLYRAAEKGTAVHKATEELDKTGTASISGDYSGYMEAYTKFKKEHVVEWLKIEEPICHEKLKYAGTLDRYGIVDDKTCIVDIKTSSVIGKGHKVLYTAAQNLYRKALEYADCKVDRLYILQLKSNGSYKLIKLDKNDLLPDALITLYSYTTF